MSFNDGDRVEYPLHQAFHQDDGSFAHPPTAEEVADLPDDHPHRESILANVQDWRPATVVGEPINHGRPFHDMAHPEGAHAQKDWEDIVLVLQPDPDDPNGPLPPQLHINEKLVRLR